MRRSAARARVAARVDYVGTDLQLDNEVLARVAPLPQVVTPGREFVDTGPYREAVEARIGDRERAPPAVVEQGPHPIAGPLAAVGVPGTNVADERLVAVQERVRFDADEFADGRFRGPTPAVDLRAHGADHRSRPGARRGNGIFSQLTVYGEPSASLDTDWASQARHRHAGFAPPQWRPYPTAIGHKRPMPTPAVPLVAKVSRILPK